MDIVVDMLKQRLREDIIYLIKVAIVYFAVVLLVFVVAGPVGEVLRAREIIMAAKDQAIPSVMLEFMGMQKLGQFSAKVEVFFLGVMVLNLGVLIGIFVHGVRAMRASYEKNRFSFFFMQLMPLWKGYIFVIAEILFVSMLSWWLYTMMLGLFADVLTSDLYIDEIAVVSSLLESVGVRGFVLVLFMSALGMAFGMLQRRKVHGTDVGLGIVGASFVLGNLYKIPQCIAYLQPAAVGDTENIVKTANVLKGLRIICPFSWLNPVNIYNRTLEVAQLGIYVVLTLLLVVVIGIWYCKRDWQEL